MPDRSSTATSARGRSGLAALRAASQPMSAVDLFDDEDPLFPADPPPFCGIRLPDARTLAWAEYGNPRGLPCLVIPDAGSSRLAPTWLLHDAAVPAPIRLLAVDRPGVGASDPMGIGGREDLADDLLHMVQTLAVGRVAVIGLGHGVDDALAFADRHPGLVTAVIGVSARTAAVIPEQPGTRRLPAPPGPPLGRSVAGLGPRRRPRRPDQGADLAAGPRPDVDGCFGRAGRTLAGAGLSHRGGRRPRARRPGPGSPQPAVGARTVVDPAVVGDGAGAPVARPQEWATHVSAIRAVADHRAGWDVLVVPGCSALLGFWPELLSAGPPSFLTGNPYGDAGSGDGEFVPA